MMTRWLRTLVLVGGIPLAFASCNLLLESEPQANGPRQGEAGGDSVGRGDSLVPMLTIGDIEQEIWLNLTVSDRSEGAGIEVETMEDARGKLSIETVNVSGEMPEHLWLQLTVEAQRRFPDMPVVVRADIVAEIDPKEGEDPAEAKEITIGTYNCVLGEQADREQKGTVVDLKPLENGLNQTALVMVRAEAMFLPMGTDEDEVDPATASAPDDHRTRIYSNPVRVNVKNPDAA